MDYQRPSGLALTGHDDNFDCIELMARSPSGEIVARAFVRIGDHEAIEAWPQRFNNTGVSHSICVYASPTGQARYVVPFYLHTHSENNLDGARRCLIEAGEQVLIQMDGPPDEFRAVSLKAIADLLDTTRSSARRGLKEAGIRPISPAREVLPCGT